MTQTQQTDIIDLISRYNSTDPKTIQKNVSKALKDAKLTAIKASQQIGVQKSTIDSWHNFKSKTMHITFENALKVADITGGTIEDLMKE